MAVKRNNMTTKAKKVTKAATAKKTAVKAKATKAVKAVKAPARKAVAKVKATAKAAKPAAKAVKAKVVKAAKRVTKAVTTRKAAVAKPVKKAAAVKAAPKTLSLSNSPLAKKQTKAQIVSELHDMTGLAKSDLKNVFMALRNLVERHMNNKGSGQFAIPELGVKVRRVNKKATKARMGRNPLTGEEIKIAAKPARKAVRATVLKSLKEIV